MRRTKRKSTKPREKGRRGVGIVAESGLSGLLSNIDPGDFGTTAVNLAVLEEVSSALSLSINAHESIIYELSDPGEGGDYDLPSLSPEQKKIAGLFSTLVFCFYLSRRISRVVDPPEVEGELSPEGLEELASLRSEEIAEKVVSLLSNYLREMAENPGAEPITSDRAAARCIYAFCSLLERAVEAFSKRGRLGRLREMLSGKKIKVGEESWKGFVPFRVAASQESSMLRPVMPENVVGNREYMEACLRTARDVAGYDFERKRNPKKINSVLFGLGKPGCGKTLVAHAAGNYFMKYCARRRIPSKFTVIRRTDWASSYQNASASNLIRIFRELHEFDGVFGIYWADIDTALASRNNQGLRSEEKANLSAAFNIFDGTLIPMDGKWFMMCDANNLEMDEALKSRISQEPYFVKGPETIEDYVRLFRDILLRDSNKYVEASPEEWEELGKMALEGGLSGRAMENISKQIVRRIQDFQYPEQYFTASFEEKVAIIEQCSNRVGAGFIGERMTGYIKFEKDEEERLSRKRFDDAVGEAVFGLNVQKELFKRAAEAEE